MNDPRLCPHCGYDLVKDAPIILNDFSMLGPLSPLYYRGQPIEDHIVPIPFESAGAGRGRAGVSAVMWKLAA